MSSPTASLSLDARQRAMLAEMGIRLWQPGGADSGTEEAVQPASRRGGPATPVSTTNEPARAPASASAPVLPPSVPATSSRPTPPRTPITATATTAAPAGTPRAGQDALRPAELDPATLDWPALQARLQQHALPPEVPRVLSGHGDPQAAWLFINDAPGNDAMQLANPPATPVEQLLDNMLRACGLSRHAGAFMAYAHHMPETLADSDALQRAWLEQVVKTLKPKVVVLMSRQATQSLLQTREAPGRLRGQPLSACGVPVVVSYPPALLLGKAEQKRRAWADLCRARSIVG